MKKGLFTLLGIVVVLVSGLGFLNTTAPRVGDFNFVPGIGGGPETSEPSGPPISDRLRLQTLFAEHGAFVIAHMQNIYDGQETAQTTQDLEKNSQRVAAFMVALGGDREMFLNSWKGHISEYEGYTKALKKSDREGAARARANLTSHSQHMGVMINELIPAVSVNEAAKLMEDHADLTLSVIEAHASGDNSTKLAKVKESSAQAVHFANVLADGLDKDFRGEI